jgi:hypothetical protein
MDLNVKKLSELHNESIIRQMEVKDLEAERCEIEEEIESRLVKNCVVYEKLKKSLLAENDISASAFKGKNYEKLHVYETVKKELREWLINNPRFIEEISIK